MLDGNRLSEKALYAYRRHVAEIKMRKEILSVLACTRAPDVRVSGSSPASGCAEQERVIQLWERDARLQILRLRVSAVENALDSLDPELKHIAVKWYIEQDKNSIPNISQRTLQRRRKELLSAVYPFVRMAETAISELRKQKDGSPA